MTVNENRLVQWRALLAVLALGGLLGAGPTLLALLSRFGPTPVERLPLLAAALFGLLFVGGLFDLSAPLPGRRAATRLLGVGAVATVAASAATLTPLGEWRYLLAPAVALAASGALVAASIGSRQERLNGVRGSRWEQRVRWGRRSSLYAAATVYVAATLLANFTLDSFLPVGSFFLVNVGTLFFGLTFTQRDRMHRHGRRAVYAVILLAAAANVALAASLGTPHRFVFVSFLTILLSEVADTEVYQRLLHRRWIVRVATSNGVSVPIDTALFTLLAFWGQPYATPAWMAQVMITDVLVKYAAGILAAVGMLALVRSVWPDASFGDEPPLPGGAPSMKSG